MSRPVEELLRRLRALRLTLSVDPRGTESPTHADVLLNAARWRIGDILERYDAAVAEEHRAEEEREAEHATALSEGFGADP